MIWLITLLIMEVILRIVLEIRERRATQMPGGFLAILRVIPLVNDFFPLPENRKEPEVGKFVAAHEEGHKKLHHAALRNLVKVIMLLLSLGVIALVVGRYEMPFWIAFVWLHLVAIPGRIIFHTYCWGQEFEADQYAFEHVERNIAKNALRNLVECEIPYTPIFALIYREHPTAALRRKKLLGK